MPQGTSGQYGPPIFASTARPAQMLGLLRGAHDRVARRARIAQLPSRPAVSMESLAASSGAASRPSAGADVHDAPVAQLDRAPDYESGGQEFESLRARHLYQRFSCLTFNILLPRNVVGKRMGSRIIISECMPRWREPSGCLDRISLRDQPAPQSSSRSILPCATAVRGGGIPPPWFAGYPHRVPYGTAVEPTRFELDGRLTGHVRTTTRSPAPRPPWSVAPPSL